MSEDQEPPQFEGIGAFFEAMMAAPMGDGPPWTHTFRPDPAAVPAPDFMPPPAGSAGWSLEEWQRFAGVSLLRDYEQRVGSALWGEVPSTVTVSWERAEALYDRVQAEARREAGEAWARETRLYWSGRPDPVQRQILRAFGVTAKQIGLVQRSAFTSEYRRRQRARVKRRRR